MNSYLLQGSRDPNLTFFDPFFWMVAMVNVCIGALPVMVSNTVNTGSAAGLPAVSARPLLSPSPAHPRLFSCSEECEFPENMSVFEKSMTHTQTPGVWRNVNTGLIAFLKLRRSGDL